MFHAVLCVTLNTGSCLVLLTDRLCILGQHVIPQPVDKLLEMHAVQTLAKIDAL